MQCNSLRIRILQYADGLHIEHFEEHKHFLLMEFQVVHNCRFPMYTPVLLYLHNKHDFHQEKHLESYMQQILVSLINGEILL
jgi:hypothetical protein